MRSVSLYLAIFLLFLCCVAAAQEQPRGPSTPEERAREVAIAHKLEAAPLDEGLYPEREWAIRWVIEVPDVHVNLCPSVLGDFRKSKYKYSSEIIGQLALSSAAFAIEHPNKMNSLVAQYVAGVEGVLKAYKAILKIKPEARSEALDDLLQEQSYGQLEDFVRDHPCKTPKSLPASLWLSTSSSTEP